MTHITTPITEAHRAGDKHQRHVGELDAIEGAASQEGVLRALAWRDTGPSGLHLVRGRRTLMKPCLILDEFPWQTVPFPRDVSLRCLVAEKVPYW